MKKTTSPFTYLMQSLLILFLLSFHFDSFGQMRPPGYERAVAIEQERLKMNRMDRDSITVVDTAIVFDPTTYEETATVVSTTYSLRDYCKIFYAMNNPEILLDGQPHQIIDPQTFEDIMIRMTPDNKFIIAPKKE